MPKIQDIGSVECRLGHKIKLWREKRGLSQTELSAIIGIDRAAISRYETGSNGEMGIKTLLKFSEALDVSTDELLGVGRPSQSTDPNEIQHIIDMSINNLLILKEKVNLDQHLNQN